MAALQTVLDNGPKIELDHHLVYYTRMFFCRPLFGSVSCHKAQTPLFCITDFEIGRLLARMGKPDEARKQFDLILSGKNLEANAATRKGKYSLEVCFQVYKNRAWGFRKLIVVAIHSPH